MSEAERLAVLRRYDILDTRPEPEFDRIVELAARMLGAPMAAIFLLDEARIWTKAMYGLTLPEIPRRLGLTPADAQVDDAFIVLDAQRDARLRHHPLVAGPPYLRYYAVAPFRSPDGHALGGIAVGDSLPRDHMPPGAVAGLESLARLTEAELERRLAMRRLKETADRLGDLTEVSSDWLWETDADHRLVDVPNHPSLSGVVPPGGKARWDLRDSVPLQGKWIDHIGDLMSRREFRNFEYEAAAEGGERRVFRISGRPRFDSHGMFLGYRGTGTDITQRRAQELTRALNQRLFDTSPDLVLATDRDGIFTMVSPSSLGILGYRPDEMVARDAMAFIHRDDRDAVGSDMRAARHGRSMHNSDYRYISKDGRIVPLSWSGSWSTEDQHYFFIGRDMTERLVAEERNRQSQRLDIIGQITSGVAHDFNNILSIMSMKIENAIDDLPDGSPVRERLAAALAAGERGASLVSGLMAFARRRPPAPVDTAIGTLLQDFAPILRTALGRNALVLEVADNLRRCQIDRTGLESAILNLAVNARDAMPSGGTLFVKARNRAIGTGEAGAHPGMRAGQWVEIAVRDTGVGMTPEVQARVFEAFFTTKEDGKGTGLGLAMVSDFAAQSGGFVTLHSTVGEGACFSLYLPATPAGCLATSADDPGAAVGM